MNVSKDNFVCLAWPFKMRGNKESSSLCAAVILGGLGIKMHTVHSEQESV